MDDIILKPCPFCGGEGEVRIRSFDIFNHEAFVKCKNCGASTKAVPEGVKVFAITEAKKLWNKRAKA